MSLETVYPVARTLSETVKGVALYRVICYHSANNRKYVGRYTSREMAETAGKHFIATGEKLREPRRKQVNTTKGKGAERTAFLTLRKTPTRSFYDVRGRQRQPDGSYKFLHIGRSDDQAIAEQIRVKFVETGELSKIPRPHRTDIPRERKPRTQKAAPMPRPAEPLKPRYTWRDAYAKWNARNNFDF